MHCNNFQCKQSTDQCLIGAYLIFLYKLWKQKNAVVQVTARVGILDYRYSYVYFHNKCTDVYNVSTIDQKS